MFLNCSTFTYSMRLGVGKAKISRQDVKEQQGENRVIYNTRVSLNQLSLGFQCLHMVMEGSAHS